MTIVPPKNPLAAMLQQFAASVAHVRGVVLVSADGMRKADHGLDAADADRLAATASGFWALTREAGRVFDGTDAGRQVAADLNKSTLFIGAAGSGSVLAVLADRQANLDLVTYEMGMLTKKLGRHLATAARPHDAAPPDAASDPTVPDPTPAA